MSKTEKLITNEFILSFKEMWQDVSVKTPAIKKAFAEAVAEKFGKKPDNAFISKAFASAGIPFKGRPRKGRETITFVLETELPTTTQEAPSDPVEELVEAVVEESDSNEPETVDDNQADEGDERMPWEN